MTAVLSFPPVRRSSWLECMSTQNIPAGAALCTGWLATTLYSLMFSGFAKVGGAARFFLCRDNLRDITSSKKQKYSKKQKARQMEYCLLLGKVGHVSFNLLRNFTWLVCTRRSCRDLTLKIYQSTMGCQLNFKGSAQYFLASSRSRMSRAMTRHAASCWYSAWASSWRACWRCFFRVKVSSIRESHSLWKALISPGTVAAVVLRGLGATLPSNF